MLAVQSVVKERIERMREGSDWEGNKDIELNPTNQKLCPHN